MKKEFIITFLTVLASITLTFNSCKKDGVQKWAGSYKCEKHRNSSQEIVIVDVTAIGNSIFNVTERNLEEYGHGLKCDVEVYSDGSFEKSDYYNPKPIIDGYFLKDSLYVSYIYPALGSSVSIDYKGKKIKK
jgi:hypothetical protein